MLSEILKSSDRYEQLLPRARLNRSIIALERNENKKSHRRRCLNFSSEYRKRDVWQLHGREWIGSRRTSENNPLSLTALLFFSGDRICSLEHVGDIGSPGAKSICQEVDTGNGGIHDRRLPSDNCLALHEIVDKNVRASLL